MNLTLTALHQVGQGSNASRNTQRLSPDNEARSYEDPNQEAKVDYGREVSGEMKLIAEKVW